MKVAMLDTHGSAPVEMANKADAESTRIKQVRQLILANLNILCPTAVMLRTLFRSILAVHPSCDLSFFEKNIWHLEVTGYIEYIDDIIGGAPSWIKKVVRLTASGKEIAERTATDPALEI